MGIYLFKTEALINLLTDNPSLTISGEDSFRMPLNILPFTVMILTDLARHRTIRSFYETNLDLTLLLPPSIFTIPKTPSTRTPGSCRIHGAG